MSVFLLLLRLVVTQSCQKLCQPCTAADTTFLWDSCLDSYCLKDSNCSLSCTPCQNDCNSGQTCSPSYSYCGVRREFNTASNTLHVSGADHNRGLCVWRLDLRWEVDLTDDDTVMLNFTTVTGVTFIIAAYSLPQSLLTPVNLTSYDARVFVDLLSVSLRANYM